jgi:hypothetical protein
VNLSLPIIGIIGGIISILVGIIIIIWPRLLAYITGAWFIIVGALAIVYVLGTT